MTPDAQRDQGSAPGHAPVRVLVVDDEPNIRTTVTLCLEQIGCRVESAASAEQALAALSRKPFDLAFLDLRLGETSGLDLLPQLLELSPQLAVIVITAYATFETAVEAVKRGARDYLPKPFTPAQIRLAVEQFAAARALDHRVRNLEERLRESVPEIDFGTTSAAMQELLDVVARAAQSAEPRPRRASS